MKKKTVDDYFAYIEACYHFFVGKAEQTTSYEDSVCIVWEIMLAIRSKGCSEFAVKSYRLIFSHVVEDFVTLGLIDFVEFMETARIREVSEQDFNKVDEKLMMILYQKLFKIYGDSVCL